MGHPRHLRHPLRFSPGMQHCRSSFGAHADYLRARGAVFDPGGNAGDQGTVSERYDNCVDGARGKQFDTDRASASVIASSAPSSTKMQSGWSTACRRAFCLATSKSPSHNVTLAPSERMRSALAGFTSLATNT